MNLRELREKSGLTQQDVANLLGISRVSVSGWEVGRHKPNLEPEVMAKLLKAYNCDLEALVKAVEKSSALG